MTTLPSAGGNPPGSLREPPSRNIVAARRSSRPSAPYFGRSSPRSSPHCGRSDRCPPPTVPFGGAKPFGSVARNLELIALVACLYEITTQAGILPKSLPLDGEGGPLAVDEVYTQKSVKLFADYKPLARMNNPSVFGCRLRQLPLHRGAEILSRLRAPLHRRAKKGNESTT